MLDRGAGLILNFNVKLNFQLWSGKNKPTNPETRAASTALIEKSKGEELTLADFKTYWRAQQLWQYSIGRRTGKQVSAAEESPETGRSQ